MVERGGGVTQVRAVGMCDNDDTHESPANKSSMMGTRHQFLVAVTHS